MKPVYPKTYKVAQQGCVFFHFSLATSINKFVCYFMLWYNKWEYWSLIITKGVQCLKRHWTLLVTVKDQSPYAQSTNLWKFELNWSSKLGDKNGRKKHHCHTKFGAFRCLISRPQNLTLRSQNQTHGKLLLSRKLFYFRGSRFSQSFTLSILLPSKFLC